MHRSSRQESASSGGGASVPALPDAKRAATLFGTSSLPTTLDEVLTGTACPCTRTEFKDYLASAHADENLDFLDSVDRYVESYDRLARVKATGGKKTDPHKFQSVNVPGDDDQAKLAPAASAAAALVAAADDTIKMSPSRGMGTKKVSKAAMSTVSDSSLRNVRSIHSQESGASSEGAPRQVRVDMKRREAVERKLDTLDIEAGQQPPKDIFYECYVEIKNFLSADAFPRFMQTVTLTNVTWSHAVMRYRWSVFFFLFSAGVLAAMVLTGISPYFRLLLSQTWAAAFTTMAQGYFRICSAMAEKNLRMNKDGESWWGILQFWKGYRNKQNIIVHTAVQKRIRRRANIVLYTSLACGYVFAFLTLLIPPSPFY